MRYGTLLRWKPQCNATLLFAFPWPFSVQRDASLIRDQGSGIFFNFTIETSIVGIDFRLRLRFRQTLLRVTEINESSSARPLVLNCSIGSNSPISLCCPSCWFKAVLARMGRFYMIFDHAASNDRRDTKCKQGFFSSSQAKTKLSAKALFRCRPPRELDTLCASCSFMSGLLRIERIKDTFIFVIISSARLCPRQSRSEAQKGGHGIYGKPQCVFPLRDSSSWKIINRDNWIFMSLKNAF